MKHEQIAVAQIIESTIREQADFDLLLPQIVFINIEKELQKKLSDSIISEISKVLTHRYIDNNSAKNSTALITPYFVFPDKPDKSGRYTLTEDQLLQLKNHINFLATQVDKAVFATKQEISHDINRLNTWVSIWIGVIGFILIFIPIVLNFSVAKQAADAKKISEEASNKIQEAKNDASNAIKSANKANQNSEKTRMLLSLINTSGRLTDIDINTLRYISDPLQVIIKVLKEVYKELILCTEDFDNRIVVDIMRQLGLRLHFLSLFRFIDRSNIESISTFSLFLTDTFKHGITQESYKLVLEKLQVLITELEQNHEIEKLANSSSKKGEET